MALSPKSIDETTNINTFTPYAISWTVTNQLLNERQYFNQSKMKTLADNKITMTQKLETVLRREKTFWKMDKMLVINNVFKINHLRGCYI